MSHKNGPSQPATAILPIANHYFPHSDRDIRILADALIANLNIPAGHDLVYVLGNGLERDNRAAIIAWVGCAFTEYAYLPPKDQFQKLKLALRRALERHALGDAD